MFQMFIRTVLVSLLLSAKNVKSITADNDIEYLEDPVSDVISTDKKYNIPAIHSMAMSYQPNAVMGGQALGSKPIVTSDSSLITHRYIEPDVDLEKSLKHLDFLSNKKDNLVQSIKQKTLFLKPRTLHTSKQNKTANRRYINENKPQEGNVTKSSFGVTKSSIDVADSKLLQNKNDSLLIKKDADPNLLTDSTIKGFLAKHVNFTIEDVGKNKGKDNKKEGQEKFQKRNNTTVQFNETASNQSFSNKEKANLLSLLTKEDNNTLELTVKQNNNNTYSNNATSTPLVKEDNNNTTALLKRRENNNTIILKQDDEITKNSSLLKQDNITQTNNLHLFSSNITTKQVNNTTAHLRSLPIKQNYYINATKYKFTNSTLPKKNIKLHFVDVDDFVKLHVSKEEEQVTGLKKDHIDEHYECDDDTKCPKNKYCRHFMCYECHRKHHECVEDDQCCDGIPCAYGRCDKKEKGSPGTICKKDGDCSGDGCCVIEPTIDEEHGICKVKLEEYHQCSPVLFRKVWVGDEKPKCGPCKDDLSCVEKGIEASHLVCMKKKS